MTNTPYRIAFLIYPGMTQLDFSGPAEVLHRMPNTQIDMVWTSKDPVASDSGIVFIPSATISDGIDYDMICVPGGFACTEVMANQPVLAWLQNQAESADLVTSVCTGSLILAAAGLLVGYNAGCHWSWIDHLEKFGARPVRERVVIDRNRITAGGVTAGIDFGFKIVEQKFGRDFAEALILGLEYDPTPISGGTPTTARPEIVEQLNDMMVARMSDRFVAIDDIAKGFKHR